MTQTGYHNLLHKIYVSHTEVYLKPWITVLLPLVFSTSGPRPALIDIDNEQRVRAQTIAQAIVTSIATQATTVSAKGTPSTATPRSARGRGRGRGRGRPPGMCESFAFLSLASKSFPTFKQANRAENLYWCQLLLVLILYILWTGGGRRK